MKDNLLMKFILITDVKMSVIVGIKRFMNSINFMLSLLRLVLLLGNHVIRYYLSMWVDGAHYPGRVIHLGVSSLVSTQN